MSALQEAWVAYRGHDWGRAHEEFTRARAEESFSTVDLAALSDAAWWLGNTDETLALSEELYRIHLGERQLSQAARVAMGAAFLCFLRGDTTAGSGWIGRARRLVLDEPDCVERGYMMFLETDQMLAEGAYDAAIARAREVREIADVYRDLTLGAMSLVGEGIALIKSGSVPAGLAVLDEAMLPVRAGDVEPSFAGNIYCQIMAVCHELADLPRAREWTEATERWCAGFPSAVMFAGICRVHRVQLLQVRGLWPEAEQEAERACEDLARMNIGVVAEGHYQIGELRRLRDDLVGAEQSYRRAHKLGRAPQPGLALLRLAQGRVDAAAASIRTALAGIDPGGLGRARLCVAHVEVCLAGGDMGGADAAADELATIATTYASPGFAAHAAYAGGAVALAQGQPLEAMAKLKEAGRRWQSLAAPYETARAQVLLALAYLALKDNDAAMLELDAADSVFASLGAAADRRRVATLRPRPDLPAGLTAREAEVLALVATGRSNRDIAATLVISEKTVARHLSNIFGKIGAASRTEAAAYAYTHGLAARR